MLSIASVIRGYRCTMEMDGERLPQGGSLSGTHYCMEIGEAVEAETVACEGLAGGAEKGEKTPCSRARLRNVFMYLRPLIKP